MAQVSVQLALFAKPSLDVIGNKVFGSSPQTTLTIADAQIVTSGGYFHEPIGTVGMRIAERVLDAARPFDASDGVLDSHPDA